ncbi:integrase [Pyrococcus horikoshii]|uniref:Integrase n=1 Tax=Pyrococcus horikoshii TaxID=53953 RepID=A0A832WJC6_PYRHR|nr:integrase [Pyrococcus horikoshii]HII60214.1 integrase [Pyrococcus horikoshii]
MKNEGFLENYVVDRAGFEPAASALRGASSLSDLYRSYRQDFHSWLLERVTERTAKDYISCMDKLCGRFKLASLKEIKRAIESVNRKDKYVKALRSFITFLTYEEIIDESTAEILKKPLKSKKFQPRQVFITDEELRNAYFELIKKWDFRAELLLKVLIFSGVRLTQAVAFLTSLDHSNFYVVNEKVVRYPAMAFSKGHKRAFWIYLPKDFAESLQRIDISYHEARRRTNFGRVSANTIRKWHYTFLLKNKVPGEVADFIQGRAQKNVGERHYANLTLLADEWYSRIVDKLKEVLEGL